MHLAPVTLLAALLNTDEPLAGTGSSVFPFSAAGGLPAILFIAMLSGVATLAAVFLFRKRPSRKRTVDRKRRQPRPSPVPTPVVEETVEPPPRRRRFRTPSYATERQ